MDADAAGSVSRQLQVGDARAAKPKPKPRPKGKAKANAKVDAATDDDDDDDEDGDADASTGNRKHAWQREVASCWSNKLLTVWPDSSGHFTLLSILLLISFVFFFPPVVVVVVVVFISTHLLVRRFCSSLCRVFANYNDKHKSLTRPGSGRRSWVEHPLEGWSFNETKRQQIV